MISSIQHQFTDGLSVLLSWASTLSNPTFYVYRNGELFATTQATSIVVPAATGDHYEVLDAAEDTPAQAFATVATLGWYSTDEATVYTVEELVAGTWTQRARVPAGGRSAFTWHSRRLEEGVTHQFRVTPQTVTGLEGSALSPVLYMVRHPDPPAVTLTLSAGDIVVEAA